MNCIEWLQVLLLVRVPAKTAALASGVAYSTAEKHLRLMRLAGRLGEGERVAAISRIHSAPKPDLIAAWMAGVTGRVKASR